MEIRILPAASNTLKILFKVPGRQLTFVRDRNKTFSWSFSDYDRGQHYMPSVAEVAIRLRQWRQL